MPTGEATVSVLLPVHAGVRPEHLRRALESISEQTRPPDEVVVVEDGPLTDDLHAVLAEHKAKRPGVVSVALPENLGAGVANMAGLKRATGDWIVKADADDVNVPERVERQLAYALASGADVVGAAMLEFDGDENAPIARRAHPLTHDEISVRMRMNNPVNHPASMYRRSVALDVGGYSDMRYMQDYDLFARMLVNGARFANMSDALVLFRADSGMFRRRASHSMNECERRLQRNLRSYGLISPARQWVNLALRFGFRRLPAPALRLAYRVLFRRNSAEAAR